MLKRAFTLVEILTVTAILAVLAGFLFAVIGPAREHSKVSVCAENLHQIGLSVFSYAADHDDRMPIEFTKLSQIALQGGHLGYGEPYISELKSAPTWPTAVLAYGITKEILRCPLDQPKPPKNEPSYTALGTSYGYDELGPLIFQSLTAIPDPAKHTLSMDYGFTHGGDSPWPAYQLVSCLSVDGHVRSSQTVDCTSNRTSVPSQ